MKTTSTQLIYYITSLFMFIAAAGRSQTIHREFNFKNGDEFQRQIVIKSNCVLQRGSQKLNISTYSNVVKSYKVTDVSGKNTTINITVSRILDSINALGQKVNFDSEKKPDPDSNIQTALARIVGKSSIVLIDTRGAVTNVQKLVALNDTLLSFTGIQPERLAEGYTLEFILDFSANPFLKKGYTWADATPDSETNFTIYAVTGRTTTITYNSSVLNGDLNSRINGVLLVDNQTGIILKRATQAVTTGYEVVNGVVYATTRRTATSEVCFKKPNPAK